MLNRALHKASLFFHNKFRENEAYIHELNYLFWECTRRCNLKCLHCGSDCSSDAKFRDMPFEDFLKAILPLKEKYKPDSITIAVTGGEPLLRTDLPQCGMILRENGFRWGIVTNGFVYNKDVHARLLSSGMGSVTLSIDGFEESHNWLRNNINSFDKALQALDLIASSDRLFYDIVTCVNSRNIDELPLLKDYFISKKVKAWRLFTIAPIGRAKNNSELQLDSLQTKRLMDFITFARMENLIDVKYSCEAFVGEYEKKVRDSFFFCRAGINIASVLIDGSISACPNIDRSFIQGNIYNDRFLDIWDNKFDSMRNRGWTKTGECLHCIDYVNCNGGAMHLWDEKQDCINYCINKKIKNHQQTPATTANIIQ
jgi:radical SAM enzyme (rSAM/lipoprotein system)